MAIGPSPPGDELLDDAAYQAWLYRLAFSGVAPREVAEMVGGGYPGMAAGQMARVLRHGGGTPVFPSISAVDLGRVLLAASLYPSLTRDEMSAALTAAGWPLADVLAALAVLYPGQQPPALPLLVQFTGKNQVVVPARPAYAFGTRQDFAVELWVRAPARQTDLRSYDNNILEKWIDDASVAARRGYPFMVRIKNEKAGGDAGKIAVARYDLVNNPSLLSQRPVNDGRFHHVAFVKAGAQLQLYLDGVLEATATDTTTGDTTNDFPLFVATRGGAVYPNYFTGNVMELRLWSAARTADQVRAAMGAPLAGNEPNLVGYWKLRDGAGTAAADASPGGNAGTITEPGWAAVPGYPLVARVGPAGPQGPLPFDDVAAALGYAQPLSRIRVHHGDIIDGLQAFYGAGGVSPGVRGGTGGNLTELPVDPQDPIVRVSGFTGYWYGGGPYLLQLSFTTRSGRTLGPYGGMGGTSSVTAFALAGPNGTPVIGFFGSARSGFLGSVGIAALLS